MLAYPTNRVVRTENTHDVFPFTDLFRHGLVAFLKSTLLLLIDMNRTAMHSINNLRDFVDTSMRDEARDGALDRLTCLGEIWDEATVDVDPNCGRPVRLLVSVVPFPHGTQYQRTASS